MELKLGDVQTTALIPLAVKANGTLLKNARIKDKQISSRDSWDINNISRR